MGLAPCASFEGGAQRYAHAIELWLPLDVSDIKNLVSKTSRVREHEPLRIKSDSSDGRYKNSFFFFTLLGHWALGFGDSPSTGDPRKQACVFKYRLALAPGTLSRTESDAQPGRRPRSQLCSELVPPAAGKLLPSRNSSTGAPNRCDISQGGVALL